MGQTHNSLSPGERVGVRGRRGGEGRAGHRVERGVLVHALDVRVSSGRCLVVRVDGGLGHGWISFWLGCCQWLRMRIERDPARREVQ